MVRVRSVVVASTLTPAATGDSLRHKRTSTPRMPANADPVNGSTPNSRTGGSCARSAPARPGIPTRRRGSGPHDRQHLTRLAKAHCSARVAGGDRVLSDAEWGEIARELLHGAGVAARGDAGGPRWVAIRHADDHIHIAVVLVRQDTGRRFWPYRDYPRLRETARELEQRLGLTLTAAADGTAERAPTRGEREKAARQGRRPARVELVRAIRRAAIAAHDVASFEAALQEGGYRVEIRRGPSGDPRGYKIARTGDVIATGEPVYYSGSKLAADLSLPRLLRRWAEFSDGTAGDGEEEPLVAARVVAERARRVVVDSSVAAARVTSRRSCMRALTSWPRSDGLAGSRPQSRSTARRAPSVVSSGHQAR
jgi:hypothetical protein